LGEKSYLKSKHSLVEKRSEKMEENYADKEKILGAIEE